MFKPSGSITKSAMYMTIRTLLIVCKVACILQSVVIEVIKNEKSVKIQHQRLIAVFSSKLVIINFIFVRNALMLLNIGALSTVFLKKISNFNS